MTFRASSYDQTGMTATGSFTSSVGGTVSASWAETASFALNAGEALTSTGSFTGSFIGEHLGDVVDVTSITGSLTGTLEGSASYAQTASYLNTSALASVYVGKFGADSYDGLSPERPKLTIGSALTAGASLLTGGIEGVRIEVLDGGTYPEGVDLISGIHLHAPAATLVGEMVLSTGASALVNTHYAATSSTATVLLSGSTGRGHYRSQLLDTRGTEGDLSPVIGLVNGTGGGVLLTHVDVLLVGSGSAGIADAVDGFGHIHFFCQDLYLAGDGAVGIGPFSEGSNLIGWIDHILETGGPDETIAIKSNVANSIIKLVCAEIITDTAYEITAGDVHLACPRISGSLTGLPVALISDAGISISGSISASSGQLTEGADTRIAAVSWSAGAPTATDVAPTGTVWIDTSTPLTASLANAVNVGGTHCAVRMSGDQAIATGTDTSASLDTTINDPGSNWDTDLATYTVPEDGVYLMTFTARMQTMADGTYWRVWIQKDGNAIAWHSQKAQNGQANYINVSTMMLLSTNDTINFWVRHVHGSDRNLSGGTAGGSHSRTVAEIVKLGEY